jgi:Xaa-Pro aminopeptidase
VLELARRSHCAVDAVIVGDVHDIQYLTGTREGISWLVVMAGGTFAVSRHMLVREVQAEAMDCEILLASSRSTERPDLPQFVIGKLVDHGIERIVVDPARLSAQSYLQLTAHADVAGLVVCGQPELLSGLRAVKDAGEVALTRRCVAIAEMALRDLLGQGAAGLVGRSEREIADELEARMWSGGADRQGFPGTGIIVASGPNSASAHHVPGARRVAVGEPLLIDWGAEVAGYRSDMTRTVFLEKVPEFALQAYPIVERALLRAAECLRAGAAMGEVDRAARETIMDAGYPEFHYGVGHGVGLAIHEAPWLRADATELCQANMLSTIEPGVYLPDVGGIRIENIYRVTPTGSERLGELPTALEAMVIR